MINYSDRLKNSGLSHGSGLKRGVLGTGQVKRGVLGTGHARNGGGGGLMHGSGQKGGYISTCIGQNIK